MKTVEDLMKQEWHGTIGQILEVSKEWTQPHFKILFEQAKLIDHLESRINKIRKVINE